MPYDILKKKKNINVDGAYDCDLLCKLIVDYIPSDSVKIVKQENKTVGGDTGISDLLKRRETIIKNITGSTDEYEFDENDVKIKQGMIKYTSKPDKPKIKPEDISDAVKLQEYTVKLDTYNGVYDKYKKTIPLYEFDQKPEHQIIFNSNNTLKTEEETKFSAHLEMDAGNFVNYKDTSYEGTKCFFFMPSRHTIDGEQFDLELNIYHGSFDENLGYSAHYHYHHDKNELGVEYHQHMHYHKQGLQGTKDAAHSWGSNKEGLDRDNLNKRKDRKNTVLCLLFNRGDHKGTRINTFFDQFVHSNQFNENDLVGNNDDEYEYEKIKTNKHFSFDDLLPKRRSFFNYETKQVYDDKYFSNFDEGKTSKIDSSIYGKEDEFEVVVFDYIQTIDKGILDILSNKSLTSYEKAATEDYEPILYKKNIEVITDERYKKLVRLQIKDLVSMTRVVQSKPPAHEPKEYYKRADDIYSEQRPGGAFYSYQSDQVKAIGLSNQWEKWGRGDKILKTVKQILEESKEEVEIYKSDPEPKKYLNTFNNFFSNVEFNFRTKNYLQMFESMYSSLILKVLNDKFKQLGFTEDLIKNEKNLELEFTPIGEGLTDFFDIININKQFYPEFVNMENIKKNLYLYNKIFVLKKIYYVRNDHRYRKFFKDNRMDVSDPSSIKSRTKIMLRDTINELMSQSFPKSNSIEDRIFDSKIYQEAPKQLDIITVGNGAFIQEPEVEPISDFNWNKLSLEVKEAFKYLVDGDLNREKTQGANLQLGDLNVDMKAKRKAIESGIVGAEKRKIYRVRNVGFLGEDTNGLNPKGIVLTKTEDDVFQSADNMGSDYVKYGDTPVPAYHDLNFIAKHGSNDANEIINFISSKKNISAGILSDQSVELIYHYSAIDIGQLTSNEIGKGVNDDDVLKVWRYFIQLNENGYYDYTEDFDIYNENFIGKSESITNNGNDIYDKIVNMFTSEDDGGKGKSYDDIKNKELFGSLAEEDSDTENEPKIVTDTESIENKVDSIIPIKSSNLIDDFEEIIVKIEKKKSIIFFNILNF